MEIKRVEHIDRNPNLPVKYTEMGNIIEIQYMSRRNQKQVIQMLKGGEQYVLLKTGEIKDVVHGQCRSDNKKGLYKTFALARALINTNVTDVSHVRWITLTYAENMTDTKRLCNDFRKFNQRFQYYCKSKNYGKAEYIVMMEPQGRGAWHAHLLYIWDCKAPYIPNNVLADIWGHGFVKIKKLDNVDNVGAYLTAYLGDMELSEAIDNNALGTRVVKEIEIDGEKKSFIKGARLDLYPKDFKMIRHSKGIKKPESLLVSQEWAEKKVSAGTLTFEKNIKLSDLENNFESDISYRYYNMVRKTNSSGKSV